MGLFSRSKGKRGERLWCLFCREQGYDVHRTAQYRGNTGAAGDVEGLPYMHCEVKYVQNLNILQAMEQSRRDAEAEAVRKREEDVKQHPLALYTQDFGISYAKTPIVASKRNHEPWLVTMYAQHFAAMVVRVDHKFTDSLRVFHRDSRRGLRIFLHDAVLDEDDEELSAVRYPVGDESLVTMYAEEWFTLYREWEAGMDLERRQKDEPEAGERAQQL